MFSITLGLLLTAASPGADFNGKAAELSRQIETRGDSSLERARGSLLTLPGKLALAERADATVEDLRRQAEREALKQFLERHFCLQGDVYRLRSGEGALRRALVAEAEIHDAHVKKIRPLLREVADQLDRNEKAHAALRQFLRHDAAADIVYLDNIRHRLRPEMSALEREMGKHLVPDAHGMYCIPDVYRATVQSVVAKAGPAMEIMDTIFHWCGGFAETIAAPDDLNSRFRRATADSLFITMIAGDWLKRGKISSIDHMERSFTKAFSSIFQETSGGRAIRPSVRDRARSLLDRYDTLRTAIASIREPAYRFALKIRPKDELHRSWRKVLLRESSLLNLIDKIKDGRGSPPRPVKVLAALLGGSLAKDPSGGFRIRPEAEEGAVRRIRERMRHLRELDGWRAQIGEFRAKVADPELRRVLSGYAGISAVRAAVRAGLDASELDGLTEWVRRHFELEASHRYSLRDRSREEISRLLQRAQIISSELRTQSVKISLDTDSMGFRSEGIHLFRSSAFYNPRTAYGAYVYHKEFPSRHIARVFGLFEWEALRSRDLRSFRRLMEENWTKMEPLYRTHDKLIIVISMMPEWLSVSDDNRVIEGAWKNCNARSPRDYDLWKEMVRETVRFLSRYKKITFYYEFWNEPDGPYWQEDMDSFLRLYEHTVTAVKAEDPGAKVGGCAVNQWDGRMRNDPERGPIVLELIRFARRRNLPLDFVSWHHFGRPAADIYRAKQVYEGELRNNNYREMPEFLVTEWNVPSGLRGGPYSAAMTADCMLGFYLAGVDAQTIAAWEDFHRHPTGVGPYGLLSQNGLKRPAFHVHKFLDRLSRESLGTSVVRQEGNRNGIISKKTDGSYEMVLWEHVPQPLFAAYYSLLDQGLTRTELLRELGGTREVDRAIVSGTLPGRWKRQFAEARNVYLESSRRTRGERTWVLEFAASRQVQVVAAESVKTSLRSKRIFTEGHRLAVVLAPNEVLHLKIRLK